jgi:hypothetical protein
LGRGPKLVALVMSSVLALACAPATPPAASKPAAVNSAASASSATLRSKAVPEPARPTLRTGALQPVVQTSPIELVLEGRTEDGAFEILKLKLPAYTSVLARPKNWSRDDLDALWPSVEAHLDSDPNAFAFIETHDDPRAQIDAYVTAYNARAAKRKPNQRAEPYKPPTPPPATFHLWVRRPSSSGVVSGALYVPHFDEQPGRQLPFSVHPARVEKSPAILKEWAQAAVRKFSHSSEAFYVFAARRIKDRYLAPAARPAAGPASGVSARSASDIARLMDTVSGRLSVQKALQNERSLYLVAMSRKRDVPIGSVAAPRLAHHDWAKMLPALGVSPPEEALAKATPAEFYYFRANDVPKLLDFGDEVENWGQPAADFIDSHSQDRGTLARYEVELGLKRTGLARVLGPAVVSEVALVGSDPYIHEGSDVTLIFRPKNAALLSAALDAMLLSRAAEHGGNQSSSISHDAGPIRFDHSQDWRVHRYRASAGGLEVVSNSENAMRLVLLAIVGKQPRLADEPDFRFMLARDSGVPADILAYLGDRFIGNAIGPIQKIGEARRQLALSELQVPAYAALLAGWLDGKSPTTTDELLKSRRLEKAELHHVDGAPIEFTPGREPGSRWGRPEALVPLLDSPPVDKVSDVERDAYAQFASSYESLWSDRIDPVALRLTLTPNAEHQRTLSADLRVLPLLRREYADVTEMVGQARVTPAALTSGFRAVFGIGKDAGVRRELERMGPSLLGMDRLKFDWLGDFVVLGVSDRNEVLELVKSASGGDLEVPNADDEQRFSFREEKLVNFPAYAVIGIRSPSTATLALALLRQTLHDAAPSVGRWGQSATYRNTAIVQVQLSDSGGIAVYYAITPHAIAVALNPTVLETTLDQILEHSDWVPAANSPEAKRAGQLVIDISAKKDSAFSTALSWLLSTSEFEQRDSAQLAEAIFRGAPESAANPERVAALMRAYFGSRVLTRDGQPFVPGPDGPRDPARGTDYAPIWPELPVRGSPVERLLARLVGVRSELSFDNEPATNDNPNPRSLHARVAVTLSP